MKNLQVIENDGIKHLVSRETILQSQLVHILVGESDVRTRHTVEQNGVHYIDELVAYMNHSCDPNCAIQNKEVIALRNIQPLEELTFDYTTTESAISYPFKCICGYKDCKGVIKK